MCGLIGFVGRKDADVELAKEFILDQYDKQHHRGSEGFGLIRASESSLKLRRATQEVKAMIDITQAKENILLFHHRYPTSTENKQPQTHPIHVKNSELKYDWYIQHNGVISNAKDLAKTHQNDLGYTYTTKELHKSYKSYKGTSGYTWQDEYKFNDSEALAIELARYLEGKSKEIATIGSVAFQAIKVNKETNITEQVLWGRNDSHNNLYYSETPEGIVIASELEGGENTTNFTAQALDTKHIYEKDSPKKLLEKTKTIGLVFKTEPKQTKTKSQVVVPGFAKAPEKTKPQKSTKVLAKDPPANGQYTKTGWALYKMGLRNTNTLQQELFNYLEDLEHCTNQEEVLDAQEIFTEGLDDFVQKITTKALEAIAYTSKEKLQEKKAKEDVEDFMAEMSEGPDDYFPGSPHPWDHYGNIRDLV